MIGIVRPDIRSMQTYLLEGMTMTATTSHTPNTSVNPMADLAAASGSAATVGNAAASGATTADAASIPKAVIHVGDKPPRHWVGDGFPVHGMFDYGQGADQRNPFLLMDYAAPASFTPNSGHRRGVGAHPHRGFETVTIVYAGEVEHRDSTGAGGVIGVGDVQWMTASDGIIHEKYYEIGRASCRERV